MLTAERTTPKTTVPLDVERTMQEIKEYLEKPKWTGFVFYRSV